MKGERSDKKMTLGASTSSSRRRLTVKTDTKSDDVLMPVEIGDLDLLNTVNTLFLQR